MSPTRWRAGAAKQDGVLRSMYGTIKETVHFYLSVRSLSIARCVEGRGASGTTYTLYTPYSVPEKNGVVPPPPAFTYMQTAEVYMQQEKANDY